MSSFKEGDTVIYISKSNKFFTRGDEYVVSHIDDDYDLWVKQDNMGNYFYSAASNFKLKEKIMNKMPELGSGMVVEYKDGEMNSIVEANGKLYFTGIKINCNTLAEENDRITTVYRWREHNFHPEPESVHKGAMTLLWQRTTPEQEKIVELEETINKAKSTIEEAVEQINQLKEA